MDEEIRHICRHLVSPAFEKKMAEFGIFNVQSFMAAQEGIETKQLFCDMKASVQEKDAARGKLLLAIRWLKENPEATIIEDFSDEVFLELNQAPGDAAYADGYIKNDLGRPYQDESLSYKDVEADTALLSEVVKQCQTKIMKSKYLRAECGNFDYASFLDKSIRHFHSLVNLESVARLDMEKLFLLAGRTQSGKSAVKGVIQSMCGLLRIPLVILTKGVNESIDLHVKLVRLSDGTLVQKEHIVVGESF